MINRNVPIQQIHTPLLEEKQIKVFVKREDLNHSLASGNKFYKLKYNLEEARKQGFKTLLTYGGAFSNHIYAVAGIGQEAGFQTIGVIRGEEHLPLNPTLAAATENGMILKYLDRTNYKLKNTHNVKYYLQKEFGDFYLIPEGGTNPLAVKGTAEIVSGINEFDYYACPVGTGGTIAGIIKGLKNKGKVLGFSALKGNFLKDEVHLLLEQVNAAQYTNWEINAAYHFGGYAKTKPELMEFMRAFEKDQGFLLEPIYTAKMFYGLFDMIEKNHFKPGKNILVIHTGGIQGRKGFGL